MPIDLTPTNFDFFARYVLAGFLVYIVRNAFVFGERPKIAEVALDILLLSLVNQAIWRIATFSLSEACGHQLVHAACLRVTPSAEFSLYVEVLVLPGFLGWFLGTFLRKGWGGRIARVLSFPLLDPIPRAYDHVFASRGTGFVILTFQSGTVIYGYYGPNSRAGRDPERSEMYVERLYSVDDDGNWNELDPPRAALIALDGLRAIEFLENGSNDCETQATD